MANLRPELERRLGTAVERMPAFPKSVQKILELTRNINCLPKDLVGVIDKDPVMTVKVLRVVNSAYYSLPYKVASVNQAVVYLGLNTVKNLALSFAAAGMLPRTNAAGFDIQRYLLHSLTTAAIARQLAIKYAKGEVDSGDCYVAGLLHDFGKVVFAQFLAGDFRTALDLSTREKMRLHEAEHQVIGADHAYVGALLATRWQFAPQLVDCIRDHHAPVVEASAIGDCLRLADLISRRQGYMADGSIAPAGDEPIPERFGSDIMTVEAELGDLDKVVANANLFVEAGR